MTQFVPTNIRLAVLIAAIVAGLAVQKEAHHRQHADCDGCIEAGQVL